MRRGHIAKTFGGILMKTQMKFQKIICLVMLIVGAVSAFYSFAYVTGSVQYLGEYLNNFKTPLFDGAELYLDIQWFNNFLFYGSVVMILAAVLLYISACNKRRNYYITNYIATGICAGVDIILSILFMVFNGIYKAKFLNEVDFAAWYATDQTEKVSLGMDSCYSESTVMFDLGFVLYAIVIVAALALIFNLVWKILCMKSEKKLLSGEQVAGGAVV
jgi:hypothetical protein